MADSNGRRIYWEHTHDILNQEQERRGVRKRQTIIPKDLRTGHRVVGQRPDSAIIPGIKGKNSGGKVGGAGLESVHCQVNTRGQAFSRKNWLRGERKAWIKESVMLWSGWASSQVWIFQVLEKSIEIVTPIWWGWGGG